MSLILDALNRSRQDADPVPGLATQHYVEQSPASWRRYLPWLVLLVALMLIVWLLLERRGDSEQDGGIAGPVSQLTQNLGSAVTAVSADLKARVDAPQAQAPDSSVLQPRPQPKPKPQAPQSRPQAPQPEPQASQPAAPGKVAPQQAAKPVTDKPVSKSRTSAPTAALSTAPEPVVAQANSAVAALYQKREVGSAPAAVQSRSATKEALVPEKEAQVPQEEPIDIEKILSQAQNDVDNAGLEEHPAPFLSSLSQRTKDDIPTILYQRHDYSDSRGSSSVTLNGKPVRVGGNAGRGLKVDEILPDSVVLSYKGTQFRLRALNSWVNL